MKTISQHGIYFIQDWEKFSPTAYLDQGGIPTIGWGTTVYRKPTGEVTGKVKMGDTITQVEAIGYLLTEIEQAANVIPFYVAQALNQDQFDAIVSFIYNVGRTAFLNSTLLKRLIAGRYTDVPAQMMRWNKIRVKDKKTGQLKIIESNGLTRRRAAEVELFTTPIGDKK